VRSAGRARKKEERRHRMLGIVFYRVLSSCSCSERPGEINNIPCLFLLLGDASFKSCRICLVTWKTIDIATSDWVAKLEYIYVL
jgi:hypothetical protein